MPTFNAMERAGNEFAFAKKSGEAVFQGEIACLNALGVIVAASGIADLKALGRIETVETDRVTIRRGCFAYKNSTADPITAADILSDCYIENSTTVCKTGTSKSKAGKVLALEDNRVWVEFK